MISYRLHGSLLVVVDDALFPIAHVLYPCILGLISVHNHTLAQSSASTLYYAVSTILYISSVTYVKNCFNAAVSYAMMPSIKHRGDR